MDSVRNCLGLPRDVAEAILRRVGAVGVLTSAQYVCSAWRGICRDPSMWRGHVDMRIKDPYDPPLDYVRLCRLAVDLSQGGLVGIAIHHFADDDLLLYIAERSSQLKHFELAYCYELSDVALTSVAAMIPLLEELELSYCKASLETIKVFGCRCPLLKSFKLNRRRRLEDYDNEEARAIAENMPGLVHLQLFGNPMSDAGLEAIMDACPHLESLDLRLCMKLDLRGHLGKICANKRIKDLKLPWDPMDDHPLDHPPLICPVKDEYDSDGSWTMVTILTSQDSARMDDFTVEDLDSDYVFLGI